MAKTKRNKMKFSAGLVLVAVGIVYGDIATSPMYVMKSIIAGNGGIQNVDRDFIIGSLSLVIWTITLITTVKHVLIAMKADNHGEGGIFALYSLVKKCGKWLIVPAMIGGAALLADSMLTPAVTVTTAVEGLRSIPALDTLLGPDQFSVVLIVVIILAILFSIQRSGTSIIGKIFGPFMTVWFLFLAIAGVSQIIHDPTIFKAINPVYAIEVLFSPNNAVGIMILGSVFLATTGAEALYSDMGHVGKKSIYVSWPFVKISLILNYLGQGAWILANTNNTELYSITDMNPFYMMIPGEFKVIAIVLGAMAAIIASQALITGSFSIVSEAIKLDLLPPMKTQYPSQTKGQLYIPLVNFVLWVGCTTAVLIFQTSAHMEAAYGLAITITLLTITVLLTVWLAQLKKLPVVASLFAVVFGAIEIVFFVSCAGKFFHGGAYAVFLAVLIFVVMFSWYRGTAVERRQNIFFNVKDYIGLLGQLKHDSEIPTIDTNVVFFTNARKPNKIEMDILYSIFERHPKRAETYWFVNMQVTDKPFGAQYKVDSFGTDFVFRVTFKLGFKEEQRINVYIAQVFKDLTKSGELPPHIPRYTIYQNPEHAEKLNSYTPMNVGAIRYCLIRKTLNPESGLTGADRFAVSWKYHIRDWVGTPAKWYGIENSSMLIEYVPLFVKAKQMKPLTRQKQERRKKTNSPQINYAAQDAEKEGGSEKIRVQDQLLPVDQNKKHTTSQSFHKQAEDQAKQTPQEKQ